MSVEGSSAIEDGGGIRLAGSSIRSGSQPGCDADFRSNLRTCDGIVGAQQFQGRVCCGAEKFPTTEFRRICVRTLGPESQ